MRQHIFAKAWMLGQEARGRGEGANVTGETQDMRNEVNCTVSDGSVHHFDLTAFMKI
jgi:hypothetical protein